VLLERGIGELGLFEDMLKTIFVAVVGGLILWAVQNHLKEVPSATYSVSDAIEIVNPKGNSEYAQEIVVNNSGQSVVKNISIKVPRHISTYKLTKHSSQIKEQAFSELNSFELVYPELPTKQKIKLLVRYDFTPMDKGWISINHADGNALVQESQTSPFNYLWLWLAFVGGGLTSSFGEIRRWKRESFRKWAKDEYLYSDSKPWFASASEWSEMQFEAIERHLREYGNYGFSKVETSAYYLLLNRRKPSSLSEEYWSKLQNHAEELLMSGFSKDITRYSKTEKLVDLFKLKKPESLSVEKWTSFESSLEKQLISNLLPSHMMLEDYVKILTPNNSLLNSLPEEVANKIRSLAQRYYSEDLTSSVNVAREQTPYKILRTARLDLLSEELATTIKNKITKLTRLQELPSTLNAYNLEIFIAKGRQDWMSEDEYKSICDFVSNSKSLSDEKKALSQSKHEIDAIKDETEKNAEQVKDQLDFIDKLLSNPASIERVEDYDKTFSKGNWRNLSLIASLLIKPKARDD
jgi:hypothetical protein